MILCEFGLFFLGEEGSWGGDRQIDNGSWARMGVSQSVIGPFVWDEVGPLLIFQGFWGIGGDEKVIFGGCLSLFFYERKDRVQHCGLMRGSADLQPAFVTASELALPIFLTATISFPREVAVQSFFLFSERGMSNI